MPTIKPSIITSICGDGPCKALDLATAPKSAMIPLVQAAMRVVDEWNNGNIGTEYLGADEALDALTTASDAIYCLLVPVIPGGHQASRMDLMVTDDYPVIRKGTLARVKPEEMTPLELEAVRSWLHFHASVTLGHAEAIKQRMDKLPQEAA